MVSARRLGHKAAGRREVCFAADSLTSTLVPATEKLDTSAGARPPRAPPTLSPMVEIKSSTG